MCGRYNVYSSEAVLKRALEVSEVPELFRPSYNVAPTQLAPVVRATADGTRRLALLRWGLVPHWAKDLSIGSRMINARAETVAEKPSFRSAFKRKRCLVPATGFYEWAKRPDGKQPMLVEHEDRSPFAMAGLWESWTDHEGEPVETYTIITTEASPFVAEVHHRMPVILSEDHYARWLEPGLEDPAVIQDLLQPNPGRGFHVVPVSKYVNNVRNNDPRCIQPVEAR